ncbi:hypothetical protein O181_008622 [Austropuccinia psidii MF-1]|uniref:Uncharacterized protein n=1 Tax=Austropuccinia psidii MF-1 TaxID=1389203 RepID=A0A9Q3BP51_9BASI|nr:hypothetical protein [Austropuccinia psidii MF-1]
MPPTWIIILKLAVPSQHAPDAAYHPYTRSALLTCLRRRLPSLCSCSALPKCLQCRLPSLCLCSSLPTCLQGPPHTGLILMLLQHPQDETMMQPPTPLTLLHPHLIFSATYPPYAPAAPPSTPLKPHPFSAAYHPYAQVLDP